jgi:Tfp pilus assembly protein PilF
LDGRESHRELRLELVCCAHHLSRGKAPQEREYPRRKDRRWTRKIGCSNSSSNSKAGGRVRITGQLIEADTGAHLWADKFDGELQDVFELQDGVTTSVVGAIAPRLHLPEYEATKRKRPDSWSSYDHCLRGMTLLLQHTPENTNDALAEYRKAIDLDPTFGLAYARAALCIYVRKNVEIQPVTREECAEGLRLAARSLELANDDATVLMCAAFVFANLGQEFERGAALADRAVALNPNLSAAWNAKGWINMHLGDNERAVEAFDRVLRLNPLDPEMVPNVLLGYACAAYQSGQHEDGVNWASKLLALKPTYLLGLAVYVGNAAAAGRLTEAQDAAVRLRELYPLLRKSHLRQIFAVRRPQHKALVEQMIEYVGLSE